MQKLEFEKINRHTSYKLKKGWEAQRYFNISGEELRDKALETARLNNETIIGVAFQNDLEIGINDKKDFLHILEIFRKYFNYYKIDKATGEYEKSSKGNKLRNKSRVIDSWEVPLIIARASESIPSYPEISELQIMKQQYFVDILVGNRNNILCRFLERTGLNYNADKLFANRVFVDWINKGLYSKRYRQFLKEFNAVQKQT